MSENLPDELTTLYNDAKAAGVQVFGEGNPKAAMMLVGEAPGREEAASGHPFVGPAGKVLTSMLDRLSIPRPRIWITNTYKIRPFIESDRGGVNRPPRASEIKAHRWILDREIELVHPRVIVCLGAVAAKALLGPDFRLKEERGCWHPGPHGSRVLATFHPSYLTRLRGVEYEEARDAMLADLSKAWGEAQEKSEQEKC